MTAVGGSTLAADLAGIAPCLVGGPVADMARAALSASDALGTARWASLARSCSVVHLFDAMELAFATGEEPTVQINRALGALAGFLGAAAESAFARIGGDVHEEAAAGAHTGEPVEAATGGHYGHLFVAFSDSAFWEEPTRLLRTRLERNGISSFAFDGRRVLDSGCGGGRYTVAWRRLGAGTVTGIDISPLAIDDARARVAATGISGVDFRHGSVLELPFPDRSFDVVFSNGVLHHTVDWVAGIRELVRVLVPGGLGWLYVIESPGGLFWDVVEILRAMMRNEPHDLARNTLRLLGIPANRIYYMLDHVMVPINVRLRPDQVSSALTDAGATQIRRLERGTDVDRIERIFRREPFARDKYGVGENRYVFSRA